MKKVEILVVKGKGCDRMEKERWKIRFCLFIVVTIAFITGFIYYWQKIRSTEISEGMLISIMGEAPEMYVEDGSEYGTK